VRSVTTKHEHQKTVVSSPEIVRRRETMSKWMSIGFDPDQMDPATEPNTQAAIRGALDDAAPRQTGGLDEAKLSEVGASGA
jgi:hypothetical protein